MSPRAQAVEQLLRASLAGLPDPRTWTGALAARSTKPWEAAVKKVDCPDCNGKQKRRIRGVMQACDTCRVEDEKTGELRSTGHIYVDPVTGKRPLSQTEAEDKLLSGSARTMWRATTDAQLAKASSILRQHAGEDPDPDALHTAIERRERIYATGSFVELDQALERLRDREPLAYSLVMQLCVYPTPREVVPGLRPFLDVVLELLAAWMPARIIVPSWARLIQPDRRTPLGKGRWANGQTQAKRNEEIRRLRNKDRERWTLAALASEFGLSKEGVRKILAGATVSLDAPASTDQQLGEPRPKTG